MNRSFLRCFLLLTSLMPGLCAPFCFAADAAPSEEKQKEYRNVVLHRDERLYVGEGQRAVGTLITQGGRLSVSGNPLGALLGVSGDAAGEAADTTIESGGYQYLDFGARASGRTVIDGGEQDVDSESVVTGTVLLTKNGTQYVRRNGRVEADVVIDGGGVQIVHSWGEVLGAVIIAEGGSQEVYEGGRVTGMVTIRKGGKQTLTFGGESLGETLVDGGVLVVGTGGTLGGTVTVRDGEVRVEGGSVTGKVAVTEPGRLITVKEGQQQP